MNIEEATKYVAKSRDRFPDAYDTQVLSFLADALREAQAAVVQMRKDAARVAEDATGRPEDFDAASADELLAARIMADTIAGAIRALPAPAARTYEDGVRDAAKIAHKAADGLRGRDCCTPERRFAREIEALLLPAPAVAPVAQKHDPDKGCAGCEHVHMVGGVLHGCAATTAYTVLSLAVVGGAPAESWCPKRAPVAAPKPGPTVCADCGAPAIHHDVKNRLHATLCCGSQRCCFFGCMGYATRPLDASDEKPVAFDAEKALVAMEQSIARRQHGPTPATRYEVYIAIQDALAAGRGAR